MILRMIFLLFSSWHFWQLGKLWHNDIAFLPSLSRHYHCHYYCNIVEARESFMSSRIIKLFSFLYLLCFCSCRLRGNIEGVELGLRLEKSSLRKLHKAGSCSSMLAVSYFSSSALSYVAAPRRWWKPYFHKKIISF